MRIVAALCAALCATLFFRGPAHAEPAREPLGRWMTQDREGVIEVFACGADLCGRVVGMDAPFRKDGRAVVDTRGRPQCGLTLLRDAREAEPGLWRGAILNPNDGRTWRCEFWIVGDTLHLRGYVLVPALGQTQVWTPYAGPLRPDCRL